MKFTFRWTVEYHAKCGHSWTAVQCVRYYSNDFVADSLEAAYNLFLARRRYRNWQIYSIKDEDGNEHKPSLDDLMRLKALVRPRIMDRMVELKRSGYEVQKLETHSHLTGKKIKKAVEIYDGIFVLPSDIDAAEIETKANWRDQSLPYMTFEECLAFFKKNPGGGVWRSYGFFAVIRNHNSGQSEEGFTSRETVLALQLHGHLGPNNYGGFKSYYSVYAYVPPGEDVYKEAIPLWKQTEIVARQIAARTGMPAEMHFHDALMQIQNR